MRNGKRSATTPERCGVYCGALRISQTAAPIWLKTFSDYLSKISNALFPLLPVCLAVLHDSVVNRHTQGNSAPPPSSCSDTAPPSLSSPPLSSSSPSLSSAAQAAPVPGETVRSPARDARARETLPVLRDNDFFSAWQLHSDFHTSPSI